MNHISRGFGVTYSHFSISGLLMGFPDFRVFVFGYRAQNEKPETTENRYFGVIKLKYMWICFMITILTFWVSKITLAKTNSIDLEWSEAIKRQIPATWSAMWLNHFEFDVIWTCFKCFESKISVTSEFSFLGVGLKAETRNSRKICIF